MFDTQLAEGAERLKRSMLSAGGWGYREGGALYVETTALGLLALAPREAGAIGSPEVARSLDALIACRRSEGFFGAFAGDPEPSWTTAPAILALVAHGRTDLARESARWVTNWRAPSSALFTEDSRKKAEAVVRVDLRIPGWPWAGVTFPTVEPTAMACVALTACGGDIGKERIHDGLRYLENRVCNGGGWNYGSPYFRTAALEPITLPTAKALLALRLCGLPRERPHVNDSSVTLSRLLENNPSRKAHGWGSLAFSVWGDDERAQRHALLAVDSGDGRGAWGGAPDANAAALLAVRAVAGRAPACLEVRS